ncbi:hypothetical protein FGADI_3865 [Fusarium gaditjirri]|uniref:Uncharacterized protein n=1 Tax=Fusarium gaditjirri TaxID=282569 RepID=A0A8H4TEA2_9HYPO|nr:hypothetical protein FGADI_3865 [Fusarium gaditjirri]
MSFNNHPANVRGYPYADGRGFVRLHIGPGRGRGRGQPQGFINATPGPSYSQLRWEDEKPTLYPQGYGRYTNNHPRYDLHYRHAPQRPPSPSVTWHQLLPYHEPPRAAVNDALHPSMNSNYARYQEQAVSQIYSESYGQGAYLGQAHRATKRKHNAEHDEQTNMAHEANQAVFAGGRDSMSQMNAVDHGIDFGVLKAKGHASFLNREAAIQAIEGMFQRGEPITLSWNAGLSTAPITTEPSMPSNMAKRQRTVSAREQVALERVDPQIYFKLRDTNTSLDAAINPTICGNCQDRGHTVAMCHRVRESGFIGGCAVCNSPRHSTWKCPEFPKNDKLEAINIMVFRRANMPPLAGKFWYPVLFNFLRDNPDTLVPGLPWSLQHSKRFYISCDVEDPFVLNQHRRDTERLGGVDPRTSSWENAKVYYGGDMSAGRDQRPLANHGQRR